MKQVIESKSPFVHWTGIQILDKADGRAHAEMEIRPEFLNSVGITHGGIYTSLADSVCGVALSTLTTESERFVTTDFHCNYLNSSNAGVLKCSAHVIKRGKRISVTEADIMQHDVLLCRATVAFAILPKRETS